MALSRIGWIRAYALEGELHGQDLSDWRRKFKTSLRRQPKEGSAELAKLKWGDVVSLPKGIGVKAWTQVEFKGNVGWVPRAHLVELAWVGQGSGKKPYQTPLVTPEGEKIELLWGDLVQVMRAGPRAQVRSRGLSGEFPRSRLVGQPLLELYFIDVGQGDGVLVRYPSGRHVLIDGGLPRKNQMTGKNAADFVDWKFHRDYGHHAIHLDSMVASHSDADHYGGLWDLVSSREDDELDCTSIKVDELLHPGLARWTKVKDNKDGLGPHGTGPGWFSSLLSDRQDVEDSLEKDASPKLQGNYASFFKAALAHSKSMSVSRVGVTRESLQGGGALPRLWSDTEPEVETLVLAPVTVERSGVPTLFDLGDKGQNTNGHSVCLRLDYGAARFLLTGDLNKGSMDWIRHCYGDRIGAFTCDVAKACHHGSADISYRFLEHMRAAATVISSGDAEGHAHPRPEVVAASAVTGYVSIDRDQDRLLTPLIYMTEIERSVSLGQLSHIRFRDFVGGQGQARSEGALFGMPASEIPDVAYLDRAGRQRYLAAKQKAKAKAKKQGLAAEAVRKRVGAAGRKALAEETKAEKAALRELDAAHREAKTRAEFHFREIHELFSSRYETRSIWNSRIMAKNHYGLVNVRTDGETIMCATKRESGEGWTIHSFPARFDAP